MTTARRAFRGLPLPVATLVAATAVAAVTAFTLSLASPGGRIAGDTLLLVVLLGVTLVLQAFSVRVSSQGSISVSSLGVLAAAFLLGAGPAMVIAVVAAVVQWVRRRGLLHRAVFDASNFSLSAAVAAAVFAVLTSGSPESRQVLAAAVAGAAYCLVNTGLLCTAMGVSEGSSPLAVWRERFQWATPHYLAAGPLAFASALLYGSVGVLAFALFAAPYALALIAHRRLVPAASGS